MLLWASQDSDRPSVLFIPVNTPTLVPNQSQICALLNKGFKGKTIKNLLNISTLKPGLSHPLVFGLPFMHILPLRKTDTG